MKWGGTGKYKGITGKNSWRGCSRAKDACISGTGGMSWGRSGANTGKTPRSRATSSGDDQRIHQAYQSLDLSAPVEVLDRCLRTDRLPGRRN
jgi:hypothetical protein